MSVFLQTLHTMQQDPRVQVMRQFRHHYFTNTYEHCCHVAIYSYLLARRFHLKIDEEALVRGALLHDYYLYDTRTMPISNFRHGISHAEAAALNAAADFDLTEREKQIIRSHMWPLNLTKLPRSKEALLVCIADKCCARRELTRWKRHAASRRLQFAPKPAPTALSA
ncbi:MAG: HD domain-containing protein [Pygmaiobacter massiliensis]|nr:HD domain-containing protein [Pygmaiobacter massiliensis]